MLKTNSFKTNSILKKHFNYNKKSPFMHYHYIQQHLKNMLSFQPVKNSLSPISKNKKQYRKFYFYFPFFLFAELSSLLLLTPPSSQSNGAVRPIIYTGAFTHCVAVNWRRPLLSVVLFAPLPFMFYSDIRDLEVGCNWNREVGKV